jgi:hypothetical protein
MNQKQQHMETEISQPVPTVILQSAFGGEITINALRSIVGEADRIYVRIDENKAYWVRGDKTGDIDIW